MEQMKKFTGSNSTHCCWSFEMREEARRSVEYHCIDPGSSFGPTAKACLQYAHALAERMNLTWAEYCSLEDFALFEANSLSDIDHMVADFDCKDHVPCRCGEDMTPSLVTVRCTRQDLVNLGAQWGFSDGPCAGLPSPDPSIQATTLGLIRCSELAYMAVLDTIWNIAGVEVGR